jgi:hypothetical protein
MISVPASLQAQLGESISVIADSDFWTRWDTLVDVGLAGLKIYIYVLTGHVGFSLAPDTRQRKSE